MKLAVVAAATFFMGALAAPSPAQATQYSDAEWRVEDYPGHTVIVNGTIETLVAQLRQLGHPQKQQHSASTRPGQGETAARNAPQQFDADADTPTATVARRNIDFSGGSYYCGGPLPYAHMAAYWEGMRYLQSIIGEVRVPPGPGMCSRVSCSYGAAVYICNDRKDELYLDSFARIADGLSYVITRCATNNWGTTMVAGQVFHPDQWNVIVRSDYC
ncbi:uncharacterized protein B0H64DRAFT_246935 [Chaetomium fimeti]|uniref:Secreted protein n=1 Tax=Chaetomium fimeti TaxID=1854472 RepID=A0AAE0H7S1_9PEZI|nr:hypothetical protein B0H64DRAFT_246935 [Chaetomium fimeti]